MRILVVAGVAALLVSAPALGSGAPVTRSSVVAALQAKLLAVETARAKRLPGSPAVACSVASASGVAPRVVQCWAQPAGGAIVEALAATVRCGVRAGGPCSAAGCRYSVSVLSGSPLAASGVLSVSVCSRR